MARINLLPWRAERRKQRQKEFMTMLGGAFVAGVALVFLGSAYYNGHIEGQNARNALLQQEITKVQAQIKEIEGLEAQKASLLQRKKVIEDLQAARSQNVKLFEELVRTIPDGVRLVSIKQNGAELTLNGRSQSESRVSAYMRNLEASGLITNPRLNVIRAGEVKAEDRALPFEFEMRVALKSASESDAEAGTGAENQAPAPAAAQAS